MRPLPVLEPPVGPMPRAGAYQQYRDQQILSASPTQLLLMVYDQAIVACETRDAHRAGRALTELIGSLNFDAGEIATSLFRLYEYCLWEIHRGGFAPALDVLRGLKRAWDEAMRIQRG